MTLAYWECLWPLLDCVLVHIFLSRTVVSYCRLGLYILSLWLIGIVLCHFLALYSLIFFLSRTVVSYCRLGLYILSPWLIGSVFGHSPDCVLAHLFFYHEQSFLTADLGCIFYHRGLFGVSSATLLTVYSLIFFFITNSRFLLQTWAVYSITVGYWECLQPPFGCVLAHLFFYHEQSFLTADFGC